MSTRPPHPPSTPPSGPPPGRPPGPPAAQRPPIVWPAVFGLGALVLLWPLTSLTGVADLVGAPVRAVGVVATIGAAWVGVVGLSSLPRPVLTLVLTGMAGGGYLVLVDLVLGMGAAGGPSVLVVPFVLLELVGGGALWGALAGLVAAGVQRLRGAR